MWQFFPENVTGSEMRNLKRDPDLHARYRRGKDMASAFTSCLVLGAKVCESVLPWHICEHKKQQTEYPLLSGLFSGHLTQESILLCFQGEELLGPTGAGRQASRAGGFFDGHTIWQGSCHLSIYFLLLADCWSDWKSSARAFSAYVAWCFLQSCTLSSAFPLAIFPVNLFYVSSTYHVLSKSQ